MKPETVLKWTARALGLASALLLLAFALGGHEHLRLTAREAVLFLFFPVGVVVGFIIAWRWELVGGLTTVASLIAFYACVLAQSGHFPAGPFFLLFAAPAFLHIASALAASRRRSH